MNNMLKPLMALLLQAAGAYAALPPGVSGGWYNPTQSGHGVTVEIASPTSAIVYWMVYDTGGAPMPLYVEGRIEGRRIEGTAEVRRTSNSRAWVRMIPRSVASSTPSSTSSSSGRT